MRAKKLLMATALLLSLLISDRVFATEDFEQQVGYWWQREFGAPMYWSTDTFPSYFGRALGPFGNETIQRVELDICEDIEIPTNRLRISFDLILMGPWVGNGGHGAEPAIWELSGGDVGDGETLLHTTFSTNQFFSQAFPGDFPNSSLPAGTGSLFSIDQFAVYQITARLPSCWIDHIYRFSASGLQPGAMWGLDNVAFFSIPEPSTCSLVFAALLALLLARSTNLIRQRSR